MESLMFEVMRFMNGKANSVSSGGFDGNSGCMLKKTGRMIND